MLYISSDHHFGHEKIIEYEDRPFDSCVDMNRAMIENWNGVVCQNDYVIHLGDFSLMPPDITRELCRQLNGHIILINGNHDHRTRTFWEQRAGILKWFKRPQYLDGIWLTHKVDWTGSLIWTGKLTSNVIRDEDTVLHGHCHGKIKQTGRFINCGVDAWDFTPIALPSILPRAINKIQNWIETECL